MRLQDVARLSTRMFKTNPSRTWLTILGMGVGTGAVVALVGLGFGLQGVLLEKIVFGETLLSLNVTNPLSQIVTLNQDTIDTFANIENVQDVSPMASFPALITFRGLSANTTLQGMNASYFRYTGVTTVSGVLFTDKDETDNSNNVVISQAMLTLFGVEEPQEALGDKVSFRVFVPIVGGDDVSEILHDKEYTIIGITSDNTTSIAVMTLEELSKNFGLTNFERVQVRVADTDSLTPVQDAIVEKGFVVTALSKTVEQANKIFQGVKGVLGVFGGIALVVSAIGMFNTMTITLLERTGEIGVMRTIGASSKDIMVLFVAEAVVVGILGGVVGIAIGMGVGFGLNALLSFAAGRFGGAAVTIFRYPMSFLIFIMAFSGIVGFLTGVFPARRAAKLNPLDAIRYK